MTGKQDPKAWLKPRAQQQSVNERHLPCKSTSAHKTATQATQGLTQTMACPGEFQNMLTAVPHKHKKTGYKDPYDPSNRSDKRNGGQFRRFESSYSKDYANIDDKQIQFREDGLPISARMVAGRPLMAPKLPNATDLTIARRLCKKYNHTSNVTIGLPGNKDPRHFKTVYEIVHTAPHRALVQPNPGIAAEDAARAHNALGLYN